MKLWCLHSNQKYKWAYWVWKTARARGWDARVFRHPDEVDARGHVFSRVPQWDPELSADRAVMRALRDRGFNLIPDFGQIGVYEDKIAQAERFSAWMPETFVLRSQFDADDAIASLGFPFISKSARGSASENVRLIETEEAALQEVALAFGTEGIPMRIASATERQRGYLIWQKFCAGNEYDYRVICIGGMRMVVKRMNRHDAPMASGSGMAIAVPDAAGEVADVLDMANRFFASAGTKFCGIDMVRGGDVWSVLETTIAWPRHKWMAMPFMTAAGERTDKTGADLWSVLLDEIEAGSFGPA